MNEPRLGTGPTEPVDFKRSITLLPWIVANEPLSGQGEPTGEAGELFALMRDDADQQRPHVWWNDKLGVAAQDRAADMLARNYFSHVNPDGLWPNGIVRQAGYRLPADWPDDANYVESIGINYKTPAEQWAGWLASPAHHDHVLGIGATFAAETQVGIGYARNGDTWPILYCLLTCPPEVV